MSFIAVQVGLAVAGTVLNALFAPTPPPQEGPRLSDLNLPSVNPGNPINRIWGTVSVGTQLIWSTGLKETQHTEKVKGGKGGPKAQKVTTYTYSSDIAMAVCEGPITRFRRIWANNKVLYSTQLVFGADATSVMAAVTAARQLVASTTTLTSDRLADGSIKTKDKRAFRTYMTGTPITLTTIYSGATLATVPSTAVSEAWEAIEDSIALWNPALSSDSTTTINKDTLQGLFDEFIGALETLADNMELSAQGSSDAFIDDEADTTADTIAEVNEIPLFGKVVMATILKDQNKADDKKRYDRINLYTGTETQMPDDIIEAELGVGNVPAYRGTAYFVIDELQLADFGNTLPTFKVEVESGDAEGTVQLRDIVSDLCRAALLDEEEFNVANLPARTVRGFALTRVSSAREALELLRNVHHFDVVESSYQIRFIWRYGPPDARIRPEDMAAVEYDAEPATPVEIMRQQLAELPRKIVFKYQDPSRDYSIGTATAKRTVTNNNEVETAELPMVLLPGEAKTAVEELMVYKYASRRNYKMFLPLKYGIIDPGDTVLARTIRNQPERFLRVLQADIGANHLIEMSLTDHVPPVSGIAASAYVQENTPSGIQRSGPTTAHFLDLPILSDVEDDDVPGFYVGFSKVATGWDGGVLFIDAGSGGETPMPGGTTVDDGQAAWEAVATSNNDLPRAVLVGTMHAASPYLWDRTSRLKVFMATPDFIPTSSPESTLVRSTINTLVIGQEIMQFATVTDLGDGLYELKDFIRGQRGTEPFISEHEIGDDALFIDATNLARYVHTVQQIGVEQDYKAAGSNEDITGLPEIDFTSHARSMMPYAPAHVRRDDAPSGDITISLLPRVRQQGGWADGADVAVDQPFEKYEIDIYDGATFKRTLTLDGVRSIVYSEANQVADFGAHVPYGELTLKPYQIGATVGRGFTNPIVL